MHAHPTIASSIDKMFSTKRQTAAASCLFCFIVVVLLFILYKPDRPTIDPQQWPWHKNSTNSGSERSRELFTKYILTRKQNGTKRFLYMLQTESCLSPYLQEVIGDPSVCQCDVSVLSFKRKCDNPPPPNVRYIYTRTRTSWGGGRNVLYEEAMKRKQVYLYFIIIDDDIVLERQLKNDSNGTPWRRFEEFLERVEPAVAAIDIEDKQWLDRAAIGRINMKCNTYIDESSEYFSVARYDAAFNAFHNKSIRNILPYTSKYDYITWNFSPIYINIKIELMYAGQSVLHSQIFATNSKHRPYPKHWPSFQELNGIVDEVANDIPEKYRNSVLLKGWRKHGLGHEEWSPTVCIPPPPPKTPILQFGYIDGELAVYIEELEKEVYSVYN